MAEIKGCNELKMAGWTLSIQETKEWVSRAGYSLDPDLRHPFRSFDTFVCEGVKIKIDNDSFDVPGDGKPNLTKISSAKLVGDFFWAY